MDLLQDTNSDTTIYYSDEVAINSFQIRAIISNLIRLKGRKKKYNLGHEWCAGNGAIGFYLLEEKQCSKLVLTDIFPPAISCCNITREKNKLQDQVTTYLTDRIKNIPVTEKWDLFVANPPWRSHVTPDVDPCDANDIRKKVDQNWSIHNNLWKDLPQHMTDDCDIFLIEHALCSSPDLWETEINKNGLQIYDVYKNINGRNLYVLHLIKK